MYRLPYRPGFPLRAVDGRTFAEVRDDNERRLIALLAALMLMAPRV